MRLPTPYRAEADILAQRLHTLAHHLDWADAARVAAPWVQAVRENPPPFWAMESLLKEYPISSAEGLALMRLAEALLRVPDVETAIALTADQLGRADFDTAGQPVLARLSSSAIGLAKKFLPSEGAEGSPGAVSSQGLLGRLGARTVVAATLRAVQLLGRQFVLGQTLPEAIQEAQRARDGAPGVLTFSYDMLGEGARTRADAERYLRSYESALRLLAERAHVDVSADAQDDPYRSERAHDGISIKLSALHPRYEDAQRERVLAELVPRVWGLCQLAAQARINLTIDAEEVDRLELSLDVFEALLERIAREHPEWSGFGLALQAYQTRALELVQHVAELARRHGVRLMCRLVKGAYWDAEIKRAQELGLPHYPVYTHKHHTDVSYLACARALLEASDVIYPQFATHNAGTIAAIQQLAARVISPRARPGGGLVGATYEFQRLHGMGEGVYREVLKNPLVRCRVYAPVGAHRDLLAYLVRRLLENGANSSFVHQLTDDRVGLDELLISPLRLSPQAALPLPPALYGPTRPNSRGVDLTVQTERAPLLQAHAECVVPTVAETALSALPEAFARAAQAGRAWRDTPVAERATVLRRAADALEADTARLCALLVKEAFKTWGDAVAEVREAVDFLRYYAGEAQRLMAPIALPVRPDGVHEGSEGQGEAGFGDARQALLGVTGERNTLRLTARGVWVCISPWNFPLAIFTGQVAAALATGNTVLAKPAEQTPAIAHEAVRLLHAAGVPEDALQLFHGPGETVGAALVAWPGVAGVVFTGSTAVAKHIQRALAAKEGPIVPLIAETGGINAMLVDSTALPEQVADAVVQSAFRSAGQRCSALRLLCVHEAIADGVIEMVAGAARELVVGDPSQLSTDLGPVIDREAFESLQRHLQRLERSARDHLPPLPAAPPAMPADLAPVLAHLQAPRLFEVASIAEVRQEIFGPVLQVVRWRGDPEAVIDQINALGYGLTLGLQTRIDGRAEALAARAHVGNVYVNRNIIGAVVGLQPFGGEGLSGTGPKAGGPFYLQRFCAEQTVTVNTAAAGGNVALLAG
ncbi:L-glutamate gamma-semialdehyde dehydrogenase [Hylemonella gracilis]|uniref:Bifunctional protein PutA n=1 Tax=Hylemonella gracilis ATCC 19624 TaxID=887062 RepID=F3KU17_9BURK|nr:L-glutamate gamma-semialdehyde dehydrogenase [Hylemonella gracilis]EGI76700.1 bifunctional proline dehydrogenase/pyrroline-5-carboxylate dehydrogenase [Hylemonella gracilis ATCC 19624]